MFNESLNSPIGPIEIQASSTGITKVSFGTSITKPNGNELTMACRKQLVEYLDGSRTQFELPLEPVGTEFQKKVWNQLSHIPYGKSISYSSLAIALGDIKCVRAAGTANGKNPIPIIIPCHRVIGSDGSLVGFSAGLDKKEWLLMHEGIIKGSQLKIFS